MDDFRRWVTWGVVVLIALAIWAALLVRQWNTSLESVRGSPSRTAETRK